MLIYAIVVIVLIMSKGKALLYMNGTAASIAYANSMLLPHTIGNVLLAIALYCWIAATARGSIPAWMQVIISVVVMFGYIMLEFMFILGMNLGFSIPFGTLSISLLIIITAVLLGICCKPKKE